MLAKLASIISFRKGVKIYEKIKRNHLAVVGFTTWGKLQWQRISAPTVPKGHQDERCQRALGFRCVCSNRDNQGKTCLSRLQKHPTFQLWYRHVGRSRCFFFSFHTLGCYKFQDVHQKRCEDDGFLSSASKAERPAPVSPPTTSQSFRCVQPNFRMDYQPQWMSPGTESSCHRQQTKPWKANLVNDPMDWWEPTETGLPRCYFSTTQLQSSQELRAVKRMLFSMLRRENTTSMVPSYA